MSQQTEASPPSSPPPSSLPRWVGWGLLLVLLGFAGSQVPTLWREYRELQHEWAVTRDRTIIGYIDVHPTPSFARKPADWIRQEGDQTLLWCGWSEPDQAHRWFRIPREELDLARVKGPMGRDVIRAIDQTILERDGDSHWKILPYDAAVAPLELFEPSIAYPIRVLEKVEVVNDTVQDRPVLVTFTPFIPHERAVRAYDPIVAGKRITLGLSGYFRDGTPLLYDRGTESFWVAGDEALNAVAGPRKGTKLPLLARLKPTPWADWTARHPGGLLVVGADRRAGVPVE